MTGYGIAVIITITVVSIVSMIIIRSEAIKDMEKSKRDRPLLEKQALDKLGNVKDSAIILKGMSNDELKEYILGL